MRGQHYTRNTVEAAAWCNKCGKETPHRITDRRKGPCLICSAKLDEAHAQAQPPKAVQEGLFK